MSTICIAPAYILTYKCLYCRHDGNYFANPERPRPLINCAICLKPDSVRVTGIEPSFTAFREGEEPHWGDEEDINAIPADLLTTAPKTRANRTLPAPILMSSVLTEKPEELEQCPICLDDDLGVTGAATLRVCNHTFHRGCIETWVRDTDASCPICKRRIYH